MKAMDYNALMVFSLPFISYLYLMELEIKINGKPLIKKRHFSRTFHNIMLTLIFAFWILRNINVYPINILAP